MAASPARRLALQILDDIEERGQRATAALHRRLSPSLSPQDQAFLTQLVYGVCRWMGQLDWLIDEAAKEGRYRPEGTVRRILRLAAFELLHLDSVPVSATCHQAVELAHERARRAARFVNALCRRMVRLVADGPPWPDAARDPVTYLAVRYSHPQWMVRRWLHRFGPEKTRRLLEANNATPPLTVRVNRLKTDRDRVREALQAAGISAAPTRLSPVGLVLEAAPGGIDKVPGFAEGRFTVQDESSQLVAYALAPKPGMRVLDACSAPGGKTTHVAELMEDQGEILALDVSPDRLRQVEENAKRLGLASVVAKTLDVTRLRQAGLGQFHRVLLDAPCSGLGVIRRRAEARWRKREEDIPALAELQRRLLDEVAASVAPGGRLVYSTCSTEPEETVEQMDWFLASHREFEVVPLGDEMPAAVADVLDGGGPFLTLQPYEFGTDGFFLACLRRRD